MPVSGVWPREAGKEERRAHGSDGLHLGDHLEDMEKKAGRKASRAAQGGKGGEEGGGASAFPLAGRCTPLRAS